MLLWLGAILCFIAHGISVATYEEAPNDNVRKYFMVIFFYSFFLFSFIALAWRCFNRSRICHRLLFVFSRSEKFENYGIVQKHVCRRVLPMFYLSFSIHFRVPPVCIMLHVESDVDCMMEFDFLILASIGDP